MNSLPAITNSRLVVTRTALVLMAALAITACNDAGGPSVGSGNPAVGEELIGALGCGSCHSIPGISGADGEVGPPLANLRQRGYLAGVLPNNFDNLVLWLTQTQHIAPESAMPDLGLSKAEARDVAAYLYQME